MAIRKDFEGQVVVGTVEYGVNEYEVSWAVGTRRADVLGIIQWNGKRHVTLPCELPFVLVDDEMAESLQDQLELQKVEADEKEQARDRWQDEADARQAMWEREHDRVTP